MAARVEIPLVVLNEQEPYNPISGAECTITKRGTEEKATIYKDSGATNETLANPVTSDSAGRLTGWLTRGAYECTVVVAGKTPYSEPFDASPAKDEGIDTAWLAKEAITGEKVSSAIKNAAAGTASLRTLGTGATEAAAGNDSRLSDERTPTNNSVTAAKIAPEAVEPSKIQKEAVETAKIKDANVTRAKLAENAKPVYWYSPKIIGTTGERSSSTYGYLSDSEDKVSSVVIPTGGILFIVYQALWLQTKTGGASSGGNAAVFIGENQLKGQRYNESGWGGQYAYHNAGSQTSNTWQLLMSDSTGLVSAMTQYSNHEEGFPTTGTILATTVAGSNSPIRGFCYAIGGATFITNDDNEINTSMGGILMVTRVAAGTYDIGVKYRVGTEAAEKSVKAKERVLHVGVLGTTA